MFSLRRTALKMSEEASLRGSLARLEHGLAPSEWWLSLSTPNLLSSQAFDHTLKTYSSSPHHRTHFPLDCGELTFTLGQRRGLCCIFSIWCRDRHTVSRCEKPFQGNVTSLSRGQVNREMNVRAETCWDTWVGAPTWRPGGISSLRNEKATAV